MRSISISTVFFLLALSQWQCGKKQETVVSENFTKIDSLTDCYLAIQDSIVQSWNRMIYDDNQKIKSMRDLVHELSVSNPDQREQLATYNEQIEQLTRMRYSQKTLANADIIEEYDFASNTLVVELSSLAESRAEYAYNTTLQKLVEEIHLADQRVNNYRASYDEIIIRHNDFVEKYKDYLSEISQHKTIHKQPLFQMASEE